MIGGEGEGGELIPFPNMRANRAVAEAWDTELRARNERFSTRYVFPSPLGILDDLMRRRSMPALPWPSEWPSLARRVRCHPGDSIAVVGPPGGGKTSFAIQVSRAAMGDGIPILWAPLELDPPQIAVRLVANMHAVHSILIREQWSREQIAHSLAAVDDLWRFVDRYSDPDLQIRAARDAIALAKRIYRVPPLLVVDYLGKLASLSRDIKLATIHAAENLRALGVEEECFVMMLAQPSRSSAALLTGRSEMEAATDAIGVASDSSEVENACRVVIALNVFKSDDAPNLDAHVLVTKSNTGLEGRVGFSFGKAGGVWTELDYLPATPSQVKADSEKDKRDRHRTEPPRTPTQVRTELNLTKQSDADVERKRIIFAAIARTGSTGMTRAQLRGLRGLDARGADLVRLLDELCTRGSIELFAGDRYRVVPGRSL